jgi:preprotein translocase subunit SecA
MNKQRKAIYALRRSLIEGSDQKDTIAGYIDGIMGTLLDGRIPEGSRPDQWDLTGMQSDFLTQFGVTISVEALRGLSRAGIEERVAAQLRRRYQEKEDLVGPEVMRATERIVMLNVIDNHWKEHLLQMDHLKEGIGLRGYGQKDPLVEYKKESFSLFESMRDRIEDDIVKYLFFLQAAEAVSLPYEIEEGEDKDDDGDDALGGVNGTNGHAGHHEPVFTNEQRKAAIDSFEDFAKSVEKKKKKELDAIQFVGPTTANPTRQAVNSKDVGRNDPCPCGSGKKYKKCCGA